MVRINTNVKGGKGFLIISDGDKVITLNETDANRVTLRWSNMMYPIRIARRKKIEAKAYEATVKRWIACQRQVTIKGEVWVIQDHPEHNDPMRAWPLPYDESNTPYGVKNKGPRSDRPYHVVHRTKRQDGSTYLIENDNARYGSIEKAIESAIKQQGRLKRLAEKAGTLT